LTIRKQCLWKKPAIKVFSQLAGQILCAATLCVAAFAYADRQPGSLSTIKVGASSGNIEIIHRLHSHDAELGIMTVMNDLSLSIDHLEGQAQLALYVETRFAVAAVDGDVIGAPLALDLIGAEVDGDYVLVYQEFAGALPPNVAVRNDILRDVFPEQVNHVNIAVNQSVHSLTFKDKDAWQSTQLAE